MKNLRPFLLKNQFIATYVIAALFCFSACSDQQEAPTMKTTKIQLPSYVIPTTMGEYDAGALHNAICLYLLTHYDSNLYAGYPHKFSIYGYDSLFALFAADSMTTPTGPYSPTELASLDSNFDSTFAKGMNEISVTHLQLETTLYTAESNGIVASDEVEFIRNADSLLRLCPTYAIEADTIASLQSQWSNITWATSTTSGYGAYQYLSIADSSNAFWRPGGAGSGFNAPVAEEIGDEATFGNQEYGGLNLGPGKATSGGSSGSFSLAVEVIVN